jgi:sestrin
MFRLQEYCWSDHGFDLVGRFYSGAAQLLEEEFDVAFTMTDNQCVRRGTGSGR